MRFCLIAIIWFLTQGCAFAADNASWMNGEWGVRFVLPAGNNKEVKNFSPGALAEEIKALKTINWVMINITGGSNGSYYTGPSDILRSIDSGFSPKRDLFYEQATLLKKQGLKVIVYFDAQGPGGQLFLRKMKRSEKATVTNYVRNKNERRRQLVDKWNEYVKKSGHSNAEMTARLIREYSKRYGDLIDGWWFDHGQWGNADLYISAAKSGNGHALVAWNQNHRIIKERVHGKIYRVWGLAKSHDNEDYTAGHITPEWEVNPYSNKLNLNIITQMSNNREIDGLVPHLFFPIQELWRSGNVVFDIETLKIWMDMILSSNGSATIAIGLKSPEYKRSSLDSEGLLLLKKLDENIYKQRNQLL